MTKHFIRNTATGSEYWDNEEKKIHFVPAGTKPDFDFETDAKSLLLIDGKQYEVGMDIGSGDSFTPDHDELIDFSEMKLTELKEYAAHNDIEVPSDVKTKQQYIDFLTDYEQDVVSEEDEVL